MIDPVHDQYERHPYPSRDPADERRRLIVGSPSHILEINHYVFAGRRDFRRPLRALFAGGGTGDGAIMLAQQLADIGCPGEVVHLDVSRAARHVAEARAQARGLTNLRFVTGPIEALAELALGRFDYIDCCGVLHHLADPQAGLRSLAGALAPEGGIGLMVYGALGRTGVYHAQAMLRMLDEPDEPPTPRLDRVRRLLRQLPPTNWLVRNPFLADHLQGGDAGLYDLLLHARDRAYSVPDLADLLAAGGLALVQLIEPARYEPQSYLTDPLLLERTARLGAIERAAFAELLAGNLKVHIAYAIPANRRAPAAAEIAPDLVPIFSETDGPELAARMVPGRGLKVTFGGLALSFPLRPRAAALLAQMDGKRCIADIREAVGAAGLKMEEQAFTAEFRALYEVFNGVNRLFLADRPLDLKSRPARSG
jgi:SAM-dependent methyltransferase